MSLVADYDIETLFNLYGPIIGAIGSALYMSLLGEAHNQRITKVSTHESLLVKLQINTSEFLKARGYLEGLALLKTYVEKVGEETTYHYELYAPRTPNKFFANALLFGTLIKNVGEKEAMRLKMIYEINNETSSGSEISKTFGEVFNPDFNDMAYQQASNNNSDNKDRRTAKIDSEFNFDRFFEALETVSQIKREAIAKKELKEIERLAALYGIDETNAANIVSYLYDANKEKGNRIDLKELAKMLREDTNYRFLTANNNKNNKKNLVSSDSDIANKINLMESVSPKQFLSYLQNGTSPASSDLIIIEGISKKFGLTNSVINVLVAYVLEVNDNILSKAYIEKIAASLAREGITSAYDAMNYLKKIRNGKKKDKATKTTSKISIEEVEPETPEEEDENWEELLKKIGGNNDGN